MASERWIILASPCPSVEPFDTADRSHLQRTSSQIMGPLPSGLFKKQRPVSARAWGYPAKTGHPTGKSRFFLPASNAAATGELWPVRAGLRTILSKAIRSSAPRAKMRKTRTNGVRKMPWDRLGWIDPDIFNPTGGKGSSLTAIRLARWVPLGRFLCTQYFYIFASLKFAYVKTRHSLRQNRMGSITWRETAEK